MTKMQAWETLKSLKDCKVNLYFTGDPSYSKELSLVKGKQYDIALHSTTGWSLSHGSIVFNAAIPTPVAGVVKQGKVVIPICKVTKFVYEKNLIVKEVAITADMGFKLVG
jgi:hypothetical protein